MTLASKYKKSLKEKWCLKFKTRHPDDDKYNGIVLHIKNNFIVLHEMVSLVFNGIIILPKKHIIGYRDSRFESCYNEIIRQNGEINKCRSPHWLDLCNTIPDVLKQMMQRNIWPGVEVLFKKGKESAYYLGPITEIGNNHFYIWCYDAAGKWEKEYKLTYNEIFKIDFNDNYTKNFNAYMRKQNKSYPNKNKTVNKIR